MTRPHDEGDLSLNDIIAAALQAASDAGATYADARVVDSAREDI